MLDRADEQADRDSCAALHFKLGTLLDKAGQYPAAFAHVQRANELRDHQFDSAAFGAFVDDLIRTFSPEFVRAMARARHGSTRPLFIVGMPRSGTSLVEQILASHPQVQGAGELEDIRLLMAQLPARVQQPFPACFAALTPTLCDELAQPYLDRLTQLSAQARYVSNKMPENFLHLGLVAMLFPQARVIHCRRDPLDTCLSCYFNDFSGSHAYAYDLADLGRYYHHYQRLMDHWRAVLDLPILELDNEALVADQEGMTRRLLAFCELPWDAACLRFYEHDRVVNTLSYRQVRRPITDVSIGRWRHYAEYLGPLKQALGQG